MGEVPARGQAPDTIVVTAAQVGVVFRPMEGYSRAASLTRIEGMEGLRYYSVTSGLLGRADSMSAV